MFNSDNNRGVNVSSNSVQEADSIPIYEINSRPINELDSNVVYEACSRKVNFVSDGNINRYYDRLTGKWCTIPNNSV